MLLWRLKKQNFLLNICFSAPQMKKKRWQHVYFWMNSLFKVYLIKRHALYHVLESLYLWESLEDKENNHSDIRYRFILLWKRDGDGGRDGGMGLCVRRHETEDTVCSGFSPDKNKLMRSLQQKHRSSSHSSSHLYLISFSSSPHQRLNIELQDLWWLLAEVKQTDPD